MILKDYSRPIADVYASCVDELLVNIARHFNVSANGVTSSFSWEVRKLAELGALTKESSRIIAASIAKGEPMVQLALETAMLDAIGAAEPSLQAAAKAGLLQGRAYTGLSPEMRRTLGTYSAQAANQMNLVNTVMLDSCRKQYMKLVSDISRVEKLLARNQERLNQATGKVAAGISTRQQVVRECIEKMNREGLTGFIDKGGHHWTPEAYVNMDVRTTCGNIANEAVFQLNREFGNDLVIWPVNRTARPKCYPWQGKVCSTENRSGTTVDRYGNAIAIIPMSQTSYGEPDGIGGINCHHSPPDPFIPGMTRARQEPPPKAENDALYQQSQQQRKLETKVRNAKREAAMHDASGDKEAFEKASAKVKQAQEELKEFGRATGRTIYSDRTGVVGYNRSVSGKVTAANQAFDRYRETVPNATVSHFQAYREIRERNLVKGHVVPIEPHRATILADLSSKRDPAHIMNRMLERHITDDEVQSYVDNALICLRQFNGTRLVYCAEEGVTVLTATNDYSNVDWIAKSAYKKCDFDDAILKLLEVAKKYGTK